MDAQALRKPVQYLKGVGPRRARLLDRPGVITVLAMGILLLPKDAFTARAQPLLHGLMSEDRQAREDAVNEFSRLPEQSKIALIPKIIVVLKSTDTSSQEYAAEALAAIAPDEPGTLTALIALLNAPDQKYKDISQTRVGAILALNIMAHANKATIPAVTESLKGPGREEAANFLVWMGTAAVPSLAAALHWEDPLAREYALRALIGLRGDAKGAFKELVSALDDEVFIVRRHAAMALENIKSPETHRALKAYRERERVRLRERFTQVRRSGLRSLVMGVRRTSHPCCRSYKVRIHGDGRVFFGGTGDEGEEVMKVPKERVFELLDAFEKSDFFFMRETPIEGIECIAGFSSTYLSLDEKTSLEVFDDCDLVPNESLRDLADKVDAIDKTGRWRPTYLYH